MKKLKWFSYLNDNPKMIKQYLEYYVVAVKTHKMNSPNLDPYLVYDGDTKEVLDFCEKNGIQVIKRKPIIEKEIIEHYQKYKPNQVYDALACFLKPEIPLIVKDVLKSDDKHVLLTDTDVMFFNDPSEILKNKIDYIGVTSEFDINLSDFNAGVMFFNVENMYNDFNNFKEFIIKNFNQFQVFDQDAFKLYYKNRTLKIPVEYNYKPYWNYIKPVDKIKILHFHGLKPWQYMDLLTKKIDNPVLKPMLTPFYIEMVGYYKAINEMVKKGLI